MDILVVGSGGREHALVWKFNQSAQVDKIYCAPGNGGTSMIAENVDIAATDIDNLLSFVKEKNIEFTVVGPEDPLVAGIVDIFEKEGLAIFGPYQAAARLEGSKVYAKKFMHRWDIPTADFSVFDDRCAVKDFLSMANMPIVIKEDGLAGGKGVYICKNLESSMEVIDTIMGEKNEGCQVVIEEYLEGEEISVLAISDGENYVLLDSSQDHKRIFDDDIGPNTGGMGAYSPAPVATKDLLDLIEQKVIEPTIRGMKKEGNIFKGVLYAGIMITDKGPYVLEFNVRLGDPEAQVVLPRLRNDLLEIMYASYEGRLNDMDLSWSDNSCVCVVISSGGYPGEYKKGFKIMGINESESNNSESSLRSPIVVFHAGTEKDKTGFVTSSGRVLGVTGWDGNLGDAIEKTYKAVEHIKFDRCFFRRDIGAKAINYGCAARRL